MFAKFIRQVDGHSVLSPKGKCLVVPKQSFIYEADNINYTKLAFPSRNDYLEWCKQGPDTATILDDIPQDEEPFEVLVVDVWRDGILKETIHAPNCELYILNIEGKTIDRLWCVHLPKQKELLKEAD